jgi:hypothetical protein
VDKEGEKSGMSGVSKQKKVLRDQVECGVRNLVMPCSAWAVLKSILGSLFPGWETRLVTISGEWL